MATILSLKRRISAAQNVSKTTRAMQMIAATKMKRAQDAALATRPYVEKLTEMTRGISAKRDESLTHPYLTPPADNNKTLTIVLSPDKGLAGSLVTNLLREFLHNHDKQKDTYYITVGKKAEVPVARLSNDVIASFPFGTVTPTFDVVYPISKLIDDYYLTGKVARVKILYTYFTSIFTQTPKIADLLPIVLPEETKSSPEPYLFEPDLATILPTLLKHNLEMSIYQYFLESFVSEQASRMISMQNATNNANDIIEDLRLEYNKTRQAKITSEILDITNSSGAVI